MLDMFRADRLSVAFIYDYNNQMLLLFQVLMNYILIRFDPVTDPLIFGKIV